MRQKSAMDDHSRGFRRRRWRVLGVASGLVVVVGAAVFALGGCKPPPPVEVVASQTTTVKIADGALRGGVLGKIAVFKNIPYAAPPVGVLRWRAPQPARPWAGERDATRYGADCVQNRQSWDRAMSAQPMAEDCLYLNVWTPSAALKDGKRRPVMVWIHGGAFASGGGSSPVTVGDVLAAEDVVVVTFNYRIGRFGFFAHPVLRNGSEPLGNYGLQDQIHALKWVRQNIAAFGGDPARVTIFGESAGGNSVLQLMLSPPARGLFAQAIAQSGGGRALMAHISKDAPGNPSAESRGVAWTKSIKLDQPTAAQLRALPAEQVKGDLSLIEWEKELWTSVMIDGQTVPGELLDGFAAGKQARVPFINGANGFELGALPALFRRPMSKEQYPRFGANLAKVQAAYPDEDAFDVGFISDFNFVEPARSIVRHVASAQPPAPPVFLYQYNYVIEDKRDDLPGAPHFSDVPMIFGHLDETGQKITAADRAMSQKMVKLWTGFARTGRPAADWVPYDPKNDLRYDIAPDGAARMARAGTPALEAITRYATNNAAPAAQAAARPLEPACAALKAVKFNGEGLSGSVTDVASRGPGDSVSLNVKGLPDLPVTQEYCRVQATLSAGAGSSIRMEVWLPPRAKWNGKFVGAGNSGYGGDLAGPSLTMTRALRQGYATAGNDTGHEGQAMGRGPASGAAFALNAPQKLIDYGHRAEHLTALAARQVVAAFYGRKPARSYFQGASNGGRGALMLAQRYPQDYDGIIAGAPAADWTGLLEQFVSNSRAAQLDPAAALDPPALNLLREAALARCDALDGAKDGLLEDPRRCTPDPAALLCKGGKTAQCLTAAQVKTAQVIYGGVRDGQGPAQSGRRFPGFPAGGESVQWNDWITGPKAAQKWFAEEFYRYMVFGNPQWTLADWKPADLAPAAKVAEPVLDADNPDLSAFLARGGKLILHHGWDDGAITPLATIAYFDAVRAKLGAARADALLRLFMVPGMAHGGGGPGPNDYDLLAPLDQWVEKGSAPQRVIATKYADDLAAIMNLPAGKALRTRPLCAYPQVARWDGKGSLDDAASFACVAP